jgi:hypothetical protein
MEKIKLTTYTTPAGIAFYPYLFTPDTKFDANGVYNVKLKLTDKESKPIIDLINKEIASESAKNKSTKKSEFLPYKKVDGGIEFHFKLKAKGKTKAGVEYEKKVKVFDAKGKVISTPINVYSGSTIKVAYQIRPYFTNILGCGASLVLQAVQVLNLVESNKAKDTFGFNQEDGFEYVETDQVIALKNGSVQEEKFDF